MKTKIILALLLQTSFVFCQINVFNLSKSSFNVHLNKIGKHSIFKTFKIDGFEPLRIRTTSYFKNQKISYPKNIKSGDTAIVELSHTTLEKKNITVTYYLLITNYKSKNPTIYKSIEGKLDFSNNDIIINSKRRTNIIELETRKGKVEYVIDYTQKLNKSDGIAELSDSLALIDVKYSIPIWYNNLKFGVNYYKNDTICIALYDENNNGVFNEKNIDRIIISDKKEIPYFEALETASSTLISDSVFILLGKKSFKVIYIAPQGNLIYLDSINKIHSNDYLKLFEKIPDNVYLTSDSTSVRLNETAKTGNYFFVNLWIPRCVECVQDLVRIDSVSIAFKNKLSTLSLLNSVNLVELKKTMANLKLTSPQGLSSIKMNSELHLSGYPFGLLFNKNGDVIKRIHKVNELILYLKNHD